MKKGPLRGAAAKWPHVAVDTSAPFLSTRPKPPLHCRRERIAD